MLWKLQSRNLNWVLFYVVILIAEPSYLHIITQLYRPAHPKLFLGPAQVQRMICESRNRDMNALNKFGNGFPCMTNRLPSRCLSVNILGGVFRCTTTPSLPRNHRSSINLRSVGVKSILVPPKVSSLPDKEHYWRNFSGDSFFLPNSSPLTHLSTFTAHPPEG